MSAQPGAKASHNAADKTTSDSTTIRPANGHGRGHGLSLWALIKVGFAFVLVYLIAISALQQTLATIMGMIYLLSFPIAIVGLYQVVLRKIHWLSLFDQTGSWLYRRLSATWLSGIMWFLFGLIMATVVLVQLTTYTALEWMVFSLTAPMFLITYLFIKRWISNEVKPYASMGMALMWSKRFVPFIMILLYVAIVSRFGDPHQATDWLSLVEQEYLDFDETGSSQLMTWLSEWVILIDTSKKYAVTHWFGSGLLQLLPFALGNLTVYYFACALVVVTILPGHEFRRIFSPLSDQVRPEAIRGSKAAWVGFFVVFFGLFIYRDVMLSAEVWAKRNYADYSSKTNFVGWHQSLIKHIPVEYIDDIPVTVGVVASIDALKEQAFLETRIDEAHFVDLANEGFDVITRNVDSYLDWYYQLPSEYMRIGKLLTGELENYLAVKLNEHLQQGEPFTALDNVFAASIAEHAEVYEALQADINVLIDENTVTVEASRINLLSATSRTTNSVVSAFTAHEDIINLHQRVYGSTVGAGGVLAALLVKNVIAKVTGKSVFKTGAIALGKVVAGKTLGGAGAGAAVGAAVGSIVPGLGTMLGAAIGSAVGAIGIGVGIDAMLLKVEELNSRENFKNSILEGVEQARAEFISGLHLPK